MEEIRAIQLPKDPSKGPTMASEPYTLIDGNGSLSKFVAGSAECWIEATPDWLPPGVTKAAVAQHVGHLRAVNVPKRSVEKFKDEHPGVPHFRDWAKARLDKATRALTPMDALYVNGERYNPPSDDLDPDLVGDPDLAKAVRILREHDGVAMRAYEAALKPARWVGLERPELPSTDDLKRLFETVADRYPLLSHLPLWRQDQRDAAYDYIRTIQHYRQLTEQ
jgi:hypothetical protein